MGTNNRDRPTWRPQRCRKPAGVKKGMKSRGQPQSRVCLLHTSIRITIDQTRLPVPSRRLSAAGILHYTAPGGVPQAAAPSRPPWPLAFVCKECLMGLANGYARLYGRYSFGAAQRMHRTLHLGAAGTPCPHPIIHPIFIMNIMQRAVAALNSQRQWQCTYLRVVCQRKLAQQS